MLFKPPDFWLHYLLFSRFDRIEQRVSARYHVNKNQVITWRSQTEESSSHHESIKYAVTSFTHHSSRSLPKFKKLAQKVRSRNEYGRKIDEGCLVRFLWRRFCWFEGNTITFQRDWCLDSISLFVSNLLLLLCFFDFNVAKPRRDLTYWGFHHVGN